MSWNVLSVSIYNFHNIFFRISELELKNNRKLSFLFILKTRCKAPKENDSSQIK